MKQFKVIIFVLICTISIIMYFSIYTVSDNEWIIVTEFGNPVKIVKETGLYLKKTGFLQKVNRFDKRIDLFETQPTQLLLGDKNPIITVYYIAWRINDPRLFFESVGNTVNAKQKLNDMFSSHLGIVLGDYTIKNIINTNANEVKLCEIEEKIKKATTKSAEKSYGIIIEKVGIQRLAYPSVVMRAVYERMKSERSKEADKIKAEGKEQASKILSEADKQAKEILAEAEKKALILKGEGDKEAMKIYSKAYSESPDFFNFLNSLEMYKKVLNEKTTLILSTDSELFKYLEFK